MSFLNLDAPLVIHLTGDHMGVARTLAAILAESQSCVPDAIRHLQVVQYENLIQFGRIMTDVEIDFGLRASTRKGVVYVFLDPEDRYAELLKNLYQIRVVMESATQGEVIVLRGLVAHSEASLLASL